MLDILITDNGPQFGSAEFLRFTKSYESSLRYPQSNVMVERAIQTIKPTEKSQT